MLAKTAQKKRETNPIFTPELRASTHSKTSSMSASKIPTPDPQNRAKVNQTRFPPTLIASKKQKPRKIYISLGLYCLMATCL